MPRYLYVNIAIPNIFYDDAGYRNENDNVEVRWSDSILLTVSSTLRCDQRDAANDGGWIFAAAVAYRLRFVVMKNAVKVIKSPSPGAVC